MYEKQHASGAQGGVVYTKNPNIYVRAKQIADRGKPFGTFSVNGRITASLNFNQGEINMAIGNPIFMY